VRSCAGAYVSGAAGSNACPAGSVRIEAEAACRTAAIAAGKTPGSTFVETDPNAPRGCYYVTSTNRAFFNAHAVGEGWSGYQLLCAAAAVTAGAPPPHRASVRARVDWAVLARGVHDNNTNGPNIDTRTYINGYNYTRTRIMPTALVGGAARRTAAQADGAQAGFQGPSGHCVGVQ
jgi:hypothetical protein